MQMVNKPTDYVWNTVVKAPFSKYSWGVKVWGYVWQCSRFSGCNGLWRILKRTGCNNSGNIIQYVHSCEQ
jgi:hypothetical protein